MSIQIKSFNQILGDMLRKIVADTPLNDINAGSVLLTLLEAAAANDFENNTAILNVLELLNIDAVKNNDLDARAGDYGLSRRPSVKASGLIEISNTNISKRSTGFYVIKPAPIAGQTTIYVNSTDGWSDSGELYIGRGTQNFEGPISYTSIVRHPTYSEIHLNSALQKDHLSSDSVIDAQGEPNRVISAGTIVKIPANNQNPEVQYMVLRDAILPAGEDKVSNIEVIALVPGTRGNAGLNTITDFDVPPFIGATVRNTSSFSNGKDVETDVELRNRIKSYAVTLARGTVASIISAVIGISDPDDSKQVASAVLTEPIKVGDPSILYIDDGSGFQPSFSGQSVDILLADANGTEEFLQLSNFPVPRPQVINVNSGPFNIKANSFLRVIVDGQEETVFFTPGQFLNITAATISELVVAINSQSTLFKARFTDNSRFILLYPVEHNAETIQVSPQRSTDDSTLYVNSLIKFPTDEFSYISLYQNSTRLREKAKNAELTTSTFASWNVTSDSNIVIEVDGTPAQDRNFALNDFPGASSFTSLSIEDWVSAFNYKFAGLTATVTPSQSLSIVSNKDGEGSSIKVIGGSLLDKWFPSRNLESKGQKADFELNRQTGNLRILTDIKKGDTISAGVEDAKGFTLSSETSSGVYNISSDSAGRPSEMVIVTDASFCSRKTVLPIIGTTVSVLVQDTETMRLMSNAVETFVSIAPGDYIYIASRPSGWLLTENTGLFRVKAKGGHTLAETDTFVDVENINSITQSSVSIIDSLDIKAFETDGYPQIWRGSSVNNPPAEPITGIVDSLNKNLLGVNAQVYKSNSIKITSTTETNGSIAVPVTSGNATVLFTETDIQKGNPSHIANKISEKDLIGSFRHNSFVNGTGWLDRDVYSEMKGNISINSNPDENPFIGTYSEVITSNAFADISLKDTVVFTAGNNIGQMRQIKAKIGANEIGTQQDTARTEINHTINDEVQVTSNISISSDDSIVVVMDKDPVAKTIDIKMARTGKINSGSNSAVAPFSFIPTTTEFSANDQDNEPGIDFSNTTVWGKEINNTDFSDYAVWMKARNWYAAGGVNSTEGKFIVRSAQFGPNGNNVRFCISLPSSINQSGTVEFSSTPNYTLVEYFLGSGPARPIAVSAGDTITVTGPYPDDSTNLPGGAASTGNYYDYTFSAGNFATVDVNDVMSVLLGDTNDGDFRIAAKNGNTIRVYNPNGTATVLPITNPNLVKIFSIKDNDVATIVEKINESSIVEAAAIGDDSLLINKATKEEDYAYTDNSDALGYNHVPGDSYISMYDGENWVKEFSNLNPNFILKADMALQNESPIYSVNTAPNKDGTIGEDFKLIPISVKNIHHHLTQKALSQLPIVANVKISSNRKNIQISSKSLGSDGSVEIIGGNANNSRLYIQDEANLDGQHLVVKIPAYPDTFNVGDTIKISNDVGVRRKNILTTNDTVDVVSYPGSVIEYTYNPKDINISSSTAFDIVDVSSFYSVPAGHIWRWTAVSGTITLAQVKAGDLLSVYGSSLSFAQGNRARQTGDGNVAGLPIINVDDANNSFDIVNARGIAQSNIQIGVGNSLQINASPIIKWNLTHTAKNGISILERNSNIVTVSCINPHYLDNSSSVDIIDSLNIPDGNYTGITVISATRFSFTLNGTNFNEINSGASVTRSGTTVTKYKIEKLNSNNLTRLSIVSGDSAGFVNCGVAVDDYLVIKGNTFTSNNNGRFRVLAVDNDSILFENTESSSEISTIKPINNNNLHPTWVSNSNIVTGVAGTFKNVNIGDWIKKSEDEDNMYCQVVDMVPASSSDTTTVTLGKVYSGSSAIAEGKAFDMLNGYGKGLVLLNDDDIAVYEGDSVVSGDTLSIQNYSNTSWFSINNTGNFEITEIGTNALTFKPFIRVINGSGTAENNRSIVDTSGFYITESLINKFYSSRTISNIALDDMNPNRRLVFLSPSNRSYKFSYANGTRIDHMNKLGFNTDITSGVDGYVYYTGLLQRVQRTVDGFEPDQETYPGRRAVGGSIETLPPLIRKIQIAIDVTTDEGVNLGDISNNIKSSIINYVQTLGVGQDVILSEIIAEIMNIKGVGAITFTNPVPSTERITIANNEKATVSADDIGIA